MKVMINKVFYNKGILELKQGNKLTHVKVLGSLLYKFPEGKNLSEIVNIPLRIKYVYSKTPDIGFKRFREGKEIFRRTQLVSTDNH